MKNIKHNWKFHHGLGDTLMFLNIINYINEPCNLCLIPKVGQENIFLNHPLVTVTTENSITNYKTINFEMENSCVCSTGTSTKVRICLEKEFNIFDTNFKVSPILLSNLSFFENINSPLRQQSENFIGTSNNYILCHFQGTWKPSFTNPSYNFVKKTIQNILSLGFNVIILNTNYVFHNPINKDYDFINGNTIKSTYKNLPIEIETLWHLMFNAKLFVGCDSGPLHFALGVKKPTIFVTPDTNRIKLFYDEGTDAIKDTINFNIKESIDVNTITKIIQG
jgi:hypothetical protein